MLFIASPISPTSWSLSKHFGGFAVTPITDCIRAYWRGDTYVNEKHWRRTPPLKVPLRRCPFIEVSGHLGSSYYQEREADDVFCSSD